MSFDTGNAEEEEDGSDSKSYVPGRILRPHVCFLIYRHSLPLR